MNIISCRRIQHTNCQSLGTSQDVLPLHLTSKEMALGCCCFGSVTQEGENYCMIPRQWYGSPYLTAHQPCPHARHSSRVLFRLVPLSQQEIHRLDQQLTLHPTRAQHVMLSLLRPPPAPSLSHLQK